MDHSWGFMWTFNLLYIQSKPITNINLSFTLIRIEFLIKMGSDNILCCNRSVLTRKFCINRSKSNFKTFFNKGSFELPYYVHLTDKQRTVVNVPSFYV